MDKQVIDKKQLNDQKRIKTVEWPEMDKNGRKAKQLELLTFFGKSLGNS